MKTVDFSKDITETIFRGANSNIKKMAGGSFYSFEKEIAEDYANMETEPCLYVFDSTNLNFLVVDTHEEINDGVEGFELEEIERYDGVRTKNYAQVLLFGTMCCETGIFTKLPYNDLINDANLNFRRYDR